MKPCPGILFAVMFAVSVHTVPAQTVWTVEKKTSTAGFCVYHAFWANNLFIGSGYGSGGGYAICTSTDGINWTLRGNCPDIYTSMTYNGSVYIATGGRGNIALSKDATTWNFKTLSGGAHPVYFSAITSKGTGLLVATSKDSANGMILTSTNGTTWTIAYENDVPLNDVIWTGTQFVAVGDKGRFLTSSDAMSWAASTVPLKSSLGNVVWTGAYFVANGTDGGSFVSSNGNSWTIAAIPVPSNGSYLTLDLLWTGRALVRIAYSNALETSTDGIYWNLQSIPSISYLNAVVFNGTQFLAYGRSTAGDSMVMLSSPIDTTITSPLSKKQMSFPAQMLIKGNGNAVWYALSEPARVRLHFFDLMGKHVFSGIDGPQGAGQHRFCIPSGAMAAGQYVRVFEAGNFVKRDLVTMRK